MKSANRKLPFEPESLLALQALCAEAGCRPLNRTSKTGLKDRRLHEPGAAVHCLP